MTELEVVKTTPRPCWIAGAPVEGALSRTVRYPYDGTEVADITVPDAAQVERALAAAAAVADQVRRTSGEVRAAALERTARQIAQRAEEIAETITAESGKPLRWAYAEVTDTVSAFRCAAAAARQFGAEPRPMAPDQTGITELTVVRCRPRGPVLAIAARTAPFFLAARGVAAALAIGAPVVVKPASATPLSALLLGESLAEAKLPVGVFSILPLAGTAMNALLHDERLPVISFSGSAAVGGVVADAAPRKHVALAHGARHAAIICPDWTDATDLTTAATRVATAGTCHAGQSCGAVRRVIVHRRVADRFVPALVDAVGALRTGDPFDPEVEVGPMIDEAAAQRTAESIDEALRAGATTLTGGHRVGTTVEPAILTNVPADAALLRDEVPGPVLVISVVDQLEAAFDQVNTAGERLRTGVFTHDTRTVGQAAEALRTTYVTIGDVPAPDADRISGMRAAMRDYSQEQTIVLTRPAL